MRFLLDTHAVLWFCEGNPSLSVKARAALEDEAGERWVSHATLWEVAIKVARGKLTLALPYQNLFPSVIVNNGWKVLPPDIRHYQGLLALPSHHHDPFDRLLIAQAQVEGLTLISCDPQFSLYDVMLLW